MNQVGNHTRPVELRAQQALAINTSVHGALC
jgi:hypothetical protein